MWSRFVVEVTANRFPKSVRVRHAAHFETEEMFFKFAVISNLSRELQIKRDIITATRLHGAHNRVRHSKPINFFKADSSGISRSSAKLLVYCRKKSAPVPLWPNP